MKFTHNLISKKIVSCLFIGTLAFSLGGCTTLPSQKKCEDSDTHCNLIDPSSPLLEYRKTLYVPTRKTAKAIDPEFREDEKTPENEVLSIKEKGEPRCVPDQERVPFRDPAKYPSTGTSPKIYTINLRKGVNKRVPCPGPGTLGGDCRIIVSNVPLSSIKWKGDDTVNPNPDPGEMQEIEFQKCTKTVEIVEKIYPKGFYYTHYVLEEDGHIVYGTEEMPQALLEQALRNAKRKIQLEEGKIPVWERDKSRETGRNILDWIKKIF
uniref:Lipoprotein n=1 Tax=Candidatus Kentrum sp. FW TaxID=2126338 RepID=A0A450TKA4_9GAMM|nr:MAG: hypothetical protein BECKFW1821C_GA0114237_101331 [Candidatus Kentron sp. FW]